jgi:hypothetical protein
VLPRPDLHGEIARLRGEVAFLHRKVTEYDRILDPVRAHEQAIKDAIRATHGRTTNDILVFRLAGAPDRKPMFAALDEISQEWGGVRKERATLAQRMRGYQRDLERLERELSSQQKRKAKPSAKSKDPGQSGLF